MRAFALAILAASLSQAALAADFDPGPLRGTQYAPPAVEPVALWEGVYFGGFGGISQSDFTFTGSFRGLIAGLPNVRETLVEREHTISNWLNAGHGKNDRKSSFGGFAGYNTQFEDVVLGFELDYTHAQLTGTRTDALNRRVATSNGFSNIVSLTGSAKTELNDYGTLRVRAGYASGSFLPYVTAGVALAGLRTSTNVTAQISGYDDAAYTQWLSDPASFPSGSIYRYGYAHFNPNAPTTFDCSSSARSCLLAPIPGSKSKGSVAIGFTAGAGVDFALTQNIFLRGEYQYAWFDDFSGHKFNVNTIRGGAGIKF